MPLVDSFPQTSTLPHRASFLAPHAFSATRQLSRGASSRGAFGWRRNPFPLFAWPIRHFLREALFQGRQDLRLGCVDLSVMKAAP